MSIDRFYIYKLTFKNGCTYVGKHHQTKEFDQYITSSFYYKKHKDLLEKREIILDNLPDAETCDIMETICILGDIADNRLNVNYNYGAWLNKSHFDRGFSGPSNGMYGKKHSELTRMKIKEAWKRNYNKRVVALRKASNSQKRKDANSKMNKDPEHIKKVNDTKHSNLRKYARYICVKDHNVVVDYDTYTYTLKRDVRFRKCPDETPLSGDINKWIKENKPGRGNSVAGKHWYNNGVIEIYDTSCPKGFVKGRLKFSKETISNMKLAMQKVVLNGGNRHMTGRQPWNKGIPLSQEQREKLYKPVIDVETGIKYESVKCLLEEKGISRTKYYKDKKNGKYKSAGK